MAEAIPLRQLQSGQTGVVVKVRARGELGRRMREMGLVPGTAVRILGRAPLKDPVEIKLMGYNLTLRNNEADHIWVKTEEAQ
jgi:ferrous iron transport protein A